MLFASDFSSAINDKCRVEQAEVANEKYLPAHRRIPGIFATCVGGHSRPEVGFLSECSSITTMQQ